MVFAFTTCLTLSCVQPQTLERKVCELATLTKLSQENRRNHGNMSSVKKKCLCQQCNQVSLDHQSCNRQQWAFFNFLSDHKCWQLLSYKKSEETPHIPPLLKSAIKSWGYDSQGSVADVCDLSAMGDGIVCWPAIFICFPLVYIHEQKCKINLVTQHVCTTYLHILK